MASDNETPTQHYIDNVEFTTEMAEYSQLCRAAKKKGKDKPVITNAIGLKFLLLAQNLSTSFKFRGYTFKDEMVGDAIENMTRYAHNFDETKTGKTGAFSYFTQISYFAFLRRIEKEEKQYRTKVKWVQSFAVLDMMPEHRQDHDQDENFQNQFADYLMDYYDAEHLKIDKKKKPAEPKTPASTGLDKAINREKGIAG